MQNHAHIAHIRELHVGVNDWIDAYRAICAAFSTKMPYAPQRSADFKFIAFAETVAQAMYADIMLGKESGGTYYMDGRKVRNGVDHVYCVGGAYPTGIVLDKSEMESYVDVLAAIQLLREVIVQLQSDSDEPVGLGFWIDEYNPDECWIDASNLVDDRDEAISLMLSRGEKAIWDVYSQTEVRASVKHISEADRIAGDKRFSEWKRRSVARMMGR